VTKPAESFTRMVRIPEGLGDPSEEVAQMLMAVGLVAWASAQVDEVLRQLFCGLEGSKYASVTAGGQGTTWLVQACKALARWRDDVSVEHRNELFKLLTSINQHMEERHSYVHSTWVFQEPGGQAYFSQSRRHRYFETPHLATPDEVIETGRALVEARQSVTTWMDTAGIKGEDLAGAMKWEAFWNQPSEDDID
jgi:hypothetical protein